MGNKNRPADIVHVRVHDWLGNIVDAMKAKTTEKDKGALMVGRQMDLFNININDVHQAKMKDVENNAFDKGDVKSNTWQVDARKWKTRMRPNIVE